MLMGAAVGDRGGGGGGGCMYVETEDEKGGELPICCTVVARAERVNPTGSSLHSLA